MDIYNMKKIPLMVLLILIISGSAWGQPDFFRGHETERERERLREDIENLRIWKMTRYLDLTTEQSEKYFPIFNKFRKQQEEIEKQKIDLIQKIGKAADLPDYPGENLKKMLIKLDEIREKEIKLRRDFRDDAMKILTIHQTAKLTVFEHRFQREIQRLVREARQKKMRNRPFRDNR